MSDFKIGDKVKLRDDWKRITIDASLPTYWSAEFVDNSSPDGVFKVSEINIYGGYILVKLSPHKGMCYQEFWVYSNIFDKYEGDWLDDLPID